MEHVFALWEASQLVSLDVIIQANRARRLLPVGEDAVLQVGMIIHQCDLRDDVFGCPGVGVAVVAALRSQFFHRQLLHSLLAKLGQVASLKVSLDEGDDEAKAHAHEQHERHGHHVRRVRRPVPRSRRQRYSENAVTVGVKLAIEDGKVVHLTRREPR